MEKVFDDIAEKCLAEICALQQGRQDESFMITPEVAREVIKQYILTALQKVIDKKNNDYPTCAHCRGEIGVILTTLTDQAKKDAILNRTGCLLADFQELQGVANEMLKELQEVQLNFYRREWNAPKLDAAVKNYTALAESVRGYPILHDISYYETND